MIAHITTYTHRRVNLFEMKTDDICIEDIAHHLACINRFNGALKIPVNVAHHSICVADLVKHTVHELQALLHDAGEAYCGDVTKWLKHSPQMAQYREFEERVQRLVYKKFGCALDTHPTVLKADQLMVRFEADQSGILIPHPDYGPPTMGERCRIGQWVPQNWRNSERAFLKRFHALHRT